MTRPSQNPLGKRRGRGSPPSEFPGPASQRRTDLSYAQDCQANPVGVGLRVEFNFPIEVPDTQAQNYIKRSTTVDQQLLALRMKYVPVFEKVISPKKAALWYQIDSPYRPPDQFAVVRDDSDGR